jgi:hypothetical protein
MRRYRLISQAEYRAMVVGYPPGKWAWLFPWLAIPFVYFFAMPIKAENTILLVGLLVVPLGLSLLFALEHWYAERMLRRSIHRKVVRRRRVYPHVAFARVSPDDTPVRGICEWSDPVVGPIQSRAIEFEEPSSSAADAESIETARVNEQPWHCPRCGEEIEGQFYACWQCGTQRPLDR